MWGKRKSQQEPRGASGDVSANSSDMTPCSARAQANAEEGDWSRGAVWHSRVRPLPLLLFLSRQPRFALQPVFLADGLPWVQGHPQAQCLSGRLKGRALSVQAGSDKEVSD